MARMEQALETQLKEDPEATVNLIVRLEHDVDAYVSSLEAKGLKVRRTFKLIKAVAIEGKAGACLQLASEPWVQAIEEDREVTIME
ncbi:MAG: hypothetical protein ACE5NP_08105 [Anaerolineae bacterium]